MVSLTDLRLRAVRARIGELASGRASPGALGSITLRPHQQLAVSRVTHMIARHGGCLLADDVGRGKTYVALAVARWWRRPLVVVPAALRSTWQRAMERSRVTCAVVTHEALSRGALPSREPDGVIVDESHHFRSPDAHRHSALAAITAYTPVLLLSATPLQNGTRDLAAQLAFFLGSAAFRSSEAALARFIVRSGERDAAELPMAAPPTWLHTGHDDGAVLRAILALPPPARPLDAGDAGALRIIGLVRAWASSRAALAGALRRRMRDVTALDQCAANGLAPARRDLRAWHGVDGDVQLALAPLLVPRAAGRNARALLNAVRAERAALDGLRDTLHKSPDPDPARVRELRRLRADHPDERILAFSEFATTVRAYFALLRADAGVGMLTSSEARIASGRLRRDALVERFAPAAHGVRDPAPRERVTLLLSTDLLSEGVNLQDASIVVHLDLPWNPARLAQRLGRVRRPGGSTFVRSFLVSPPATTELLLRVEARLRTKLAQTERTIGRTLDVMPTLAAPAEAAARISGPATADDTIAGANAELLGVIAERVAGWRHACPRQHGKPFRVPLVAAVMCEENGRLAVLDDGRLLARAGSTTVGTGTVVARAVELASGAARTCTRLERQQALTEATRWIEREALAAECGVRDEVSALDASVERVIGRLLARAARHERPRRLELAGRLRETLGSPRSLGAERAMEALMRMHAERALDDVTWLERALEITTRSSARVTPIGSRIAALIVLGPASDA